MTNRFLLGMFAVLVFATSVRAGETAAFTTDSLTKIKAQYAGRPFILNLWSVNDCSYCLAELVLMGKYVKMQKRPFLVLVETNSPDQISAIQKTLGPLGLSQVDSWVFDDPIPERLRHALDTSWYGEVPRTYLYDAQHQRETIVGVLSEERLRTWLKKHKLVD